MRRAQEVNDGLRRPSLTHGSQPAAGRFVTRSAMWSRSPRSRHPSRDWSGWMRTPTRDFRPCRTSYAHQAPNTSRRPRTISHDRLGRLGAAHADDVHRIHVLAQMRQSPVDRLKGVTSRLDCTPEFRAGPHKDTGRRTALLLDIGGAQNFGAVPRTRRAAPRALHRRFRTVPGATNPARCGRASGLQDRRLRRSPPLHPPWRRRGRRHVPVRADCGELPHRR